MVVDYADDQTDRVFRALADRTRRDILRRAMHGTLSVSDLARHYPMSVTAVQKHVNVLEQAELVTRTRRGRQQLVQTTMDGAATATQLLDQLESLWRSRIDRIDGLLATEATEATEENRR